MAKNENETYKTDKDEKVPFFYTNFQFNTVPKNERQKARFSGRNFST